MLEIYAVVYVRNLFFLNDKNFFVVKPDTYHKAKFVSIGTSAVIEMNEKSYHYNSIIFYLGGNVSMLFSIPPESSDSPNILCCSPEGECTLWVTRLLPLNGKVTIPSSDQQYVHYRAEDSQCSFSC